MSQLTHLNRGGEARMVDVSEKAATERVAAAEGRVVMTAKTLDVVLAGNAKKGDVLGAARLAGIMAAERDIIEQRSRLVALMPVAEALARVLADAEPLAAEATPLADAYGRVLAADVAALRTQPPADVSAMDGYAVRSADVARVPVKLKVVGEVAAGHPFHGTVGAGEAARILTGGVLPHGTDTIVIQENTSREGDAVTVTTPSGKGKHIRVEGLDFKRGAVLLAKGRRLTDRDVALAAAMTHPTVPVHRCPKVAWPA